MLTLKYFSDYSIVLNLINRLFPEKNNLKFNFKPEEILVVIKSKLGEKND